MNQKINECGEVNWAALKRLSDQYKDEEPFDVYDLILFHKFFNDLYTRKCGSEIHSKDDVTSTPLSNNSQLTKELVNELNRDFTLQEIKDATKKLKNNKSVSDDLISNEMLKNSNEKLQLVVVNSLTPVSSMEPTPGTTPSQLPSIRRVTGKTPITMIGP